MEKTFEPGAIEDKWLDIWKDKKPFALTIDEAKPNYCIMLPPPNVTGSLHMGHAFQDTLMDSLIRYHKMTGHNVLWQGGVDHAGIATQMVVERQLEAEGKDKSSLGRDAFIDRVWEWKERSGDKISSQMQRLGTMIDWSQSRFTMDKGLSEAVREVFIRLHDEGLIYKGKRLVNWDPSLQSAVSDLEVVTEEVRGHLWHIRYPIEGSTESLVVATTRPETLFGDVAVAVHPEDSRYAHLVGQSVCLPCTSRLIPIIADEYVDPEFGTGCVKITPAHDFNDYEIGKRHQLEMINVLTETATINENGPKAYQGLSREEARKTLIQELMNQDLLVKTVEHTLQIPRCERSGTIVEPYLTTQWYLNVQEIGKAAADLVRDKSVRFVPENWENTYFDWMNQLQDWCISRQLWWGHRIPAWYDAEGNCYVGQSEKAVRTKYQLAASLTLTQDEDVLDTWFSSALWPFSTLGWPNAENNDLLNRFYPTSVLVTGFDIIFFWVARMIMFGEKFMGKPPFKEVYVHGLINDAEGQKMSKSKGNVIDPLDLIYGISLDDLVEKRTKSLMQPNMKKRIEKDTIKHFPEGIPAYGTDALRLTFTALATQGRQIRFESSKIGAYRNFCNKLWNASRFVLQNVEGQAIASTPSLNTPIEQWLSNGLQTLVNEVHQHFATYRFDLLVQRIYEFTWDIYCDWYLEFSKISLNSESASDESKANVRFHLVNTLTTLLKLLHPLAPFITEEIWAKAIASHPTESSELLVNADFPEKSAIADTASSQAVEEIREVIGAIRNIRGEMNISPGKPLPLIAHQEPEWFKDVALRETVLLVAKVSDFSVQEPDNRMSASFLVNQVSYSLPLAGVVDKAAETTRTEKAIQKIDKQLQGLAKKLDNESYLQRAPEELVAKDRALHESLIAKLQQLQNHLSNILKL